MKLATPALAALLFLATPAFSQTAPPVSSVTPYVPVLRYDPARNAEIDIKLAVVEAKRSGRRILLEVGGEWCVWCRRLDTLFLKNQPLTLFRDMHFVMVKVNWSKENKNESALSKYPAIPGYPHLFVLDAYGQLLHSQSTGDLEQGEGHDPAKVRAFLRDWAAPVTR
jgi:thiol:disulfide interchange protein